MHISVLLKNIRFYDITMLYILQYIFNTFIT